MTPPDWGRFYSFTKDSAPWPLLMRAAALASRHGRALDLGAGAGRDTRYLLAQGFQVTAVDGEPQSVALLSSLPHAQDRLHVVQSTFADFPFEIATYDLISAQFALPFTPRDHFNGMFARLKAALAPGGIFAGQLFGVHDELAEEDEDGHKADGSPKHWHVFHILARRRPTQPE